MKIVKHLYWTLRHTYDHAWRFALGIPMYGMTYGFGHALRFMFARLWFTFTRQVIPIAFSKCYVISTPQQLINHQSIFVEEELWHTSMLKCKTVLDVGANIGQSVWFWKSKIPGVHVKAVEPMASFDLLVAGQLYDTGTQTTMVFKSALSSNGDTNGLIELRVCRDVGGLTASTKIYKGGDAKIVIATPKVHGEFDLIKIDVDGSELDILGCLTEAQWKNVKVFCIECVDGSLDAINAKIMKHRPDMKRAQTGNIDFVWFTE
jgi:FkbM family methyltransferase